jgi:hypothetical protein
MPIKGLTDRGSAFPEIGSIRKGAAKPERGIGRDLSYFRVEFDEKEQDAAATFKAKYGPEPAEITIMLPFNEIDRMWDAWYEAYTAGRLVARSDGEKFIYLIDPQTGEQIVTGGLPFTAHRAVVGSYQKQGGGNEEIKCKPTGRLKIVIPELQRLAYLTVHTTSIHDIANISSQLEAIQRINGGQLAGIPLVLRRRPKKISMPMAGGKRGRVTKYMLSIEADPEWVKRKLTQLKTDALPGNGLALLPPAQQGPEPEPEIEDAHDYEDYDEDEITDAEFEPAETEQEPDPLDQYRELKTRTGRRLGDLTTDELKRLKAGIQVTEQKNGGLTDDQRKQLDGCDALIESYELPL